MLESEISLLRFSIFILVISCLLLAEWRSPFRRYSVSKMKRFLDNIGLMSLSFGILQVISAGSAYLAAQWAMNQQFGLFNDLSVPFWASCILTLIIFDFAIYLQHRVFHKIPWLWKIHQVHHSDIGIDCSTAVRFHFLEIILSTWYKMLLVILTGAAPLAVVAFEVLLNSFALFNHSNIQLSPTLEKMIGRWIITPDMHRIHHSRIWQETNSNFGFSVPFWDKFCKTYRSTAQAGQQDIDIGAPDLPKQQSYHFWELLLLPFKTR